MIHNRILVVAFCALAAVAGLAHGQSSPQMDSPRAEVARVAPVVARRGMVVAQEKRAAKIGVEVLRQGGNAVDAAVAVGFTLAVTYPRAGNLGGGGFMVIHLASGKNIAIDYRETAPSAATPKMFLDAAGAADPQKSRDSVIAIGVPGTVAGLALAHAKYGSGQFMLAQLIAPAIELARHGFRIEDDNADSLPRAYSRLARWPASARIFLKSDGSPLGPGNLLVQRDLAASLQAITRDGPRAFYEGVIARRIAAAIRGISGIMTYDDLKNYRAIERMPVVGRYRGYDIVSMPPSSSGGVLLIEMLNVLEGYDLRTLSAGSSAALHLMIEAMRRAYADRAAYMGDPERVKMPLARLMSKDYAATLRKGIDVNRATPSQDVRPKRQVPREGRNTTHFSVVDRFGNAVANTYTLNFSYGLGLVAEGTGILLNNELDDFAAKPGVPNAFGLIGGAANAPGPGKRPLSSMTPTIVLKDGAPLLVLGSPGGSRIISTVLQIITDVIDFGMPLPEAVSAPRIHHQWLPDEVYVEPGLSQRTTRGLKARGHKVIVRRPGTAVEAIMLTPHGLVGAADTRTRGALAVGY